MTDLVNDNFEDGEGELAIVFGDFHIPGKIHEIPQQFKELITPNKVQYVICTGNVGKSKETYSWIKSLAQVIYMVKGDQDDVVPWGTEEGIYNQLREYDSDIFISGYTHEYKTNKYEQKHFLNPGSITGVFSPLKKDPLPSFMVLEIKEKQVDVYFYQLQNNEVKIKKTSIFK
ncbi:vacuolar sorting protein, putative [Ichthyophthirius multifiliis]|uniref:Vacuolar protein sorting-associated protein 29 n=1 Tax=Ichthyophthirius multifiliis TaxID=5932 RepID=G0QU99_ICHMU|nr:vacuolar sorting protein, putative [Ichthyophthirius multifiliis]EGR31202.1 vacuolar sorting protein, putative [Ichthyophthirius multifiliis]|eukprot:XP_004034688.1 vacuolar sorting protein, putative [Ichthyophthirius multifiliis]